jgi:hypothetical protein
LYCPNLGAINHYKPVEDVWQISSSIITAHVFIGLNLINNKIMQAFVQALITQVVGSDFTAYLSG